MTSSTQEQAMDRLTSELVAALRGARRHGAPPTIRRKLRTLTSKCDFQRASGAFLARLQDRLERSGLYSDLQVTDPGLRPDDWVLFSDGPFPADALFFPREEDLQRFVEACLGNGPLRNLEPMRERGRQVAREYRLPGGRIDLLCQERTRSGGGALVAIELKREHERGTIDQMVAYLDNLKKHFPGRNVRGIIISGREDRVTAARLSELRGYRIDWFCYSVTLSKVASTK